MRKPLTLAITVSAVLSPLGTVASSDSVYNSGTVAGVSPTATYIWRSDFNRAVGGPYQNIPPKAEFGCEGDCATGEFMSGQTGCLTGPKCARVNHVDTTDAPPGDFWDPPNHKCNGTRKHHMGIIREITIDNDPPTVFAGLATMITPATLDKMRDNDVNNEDGNPDGRIEVLAISPTNDELGIQGKVVQARLYPDSSTAAHFAIGVFGSQAEAHGSAAIDADTWYFTVMKAKWGASVNLYLDVYKLDGGWVYVERISLADVDTTGNPESSPRQKIGGESQLADYDPDVPYYTYHDDFYLAYSDQGTQSFDFRATTECPLE